MTVKALKSRISQKWANFTKTANFMENVKAVTSLIRLVPTNAVPLCLPSLIKKFEGGPLDQGAQTGVGWFLTSRCYVSEMVRERELR